MLRQVFARVVEHGFRFVTMQTLAERLQVGARRPMIRVLSVFGTRPEAIKMAPVVRALRARAGAVREPVCVTAQHRTMLDQVLEVFDLKADVDLDLMVPGQTPAGIAAGILDRLPPLLRRVRPDVILVQGDTTTTFAAAFAAFLERIPTGARRGRPPDRRPVAAVSGGDEPGADHPDRGAPLRADARRARRPARRGDSRRPTCSSPATRSSTRCCRRCGRTTGSARPALAGLDPGAPAGAGHDPPAGELRRAAPLHLRGHPRAGGPVPRAAVRAAGASQPRGQARRSRSCCATCRACT